MITQVNIEDIATRKSSGRTAGKVVNEFLATGWDACLIDKSEWKSLDSAYSSLREVVKQYDNLKLFTRNRELYLVKKDKFLKLGGNNK